MRYKNLVHRFEFTVKNIFGFCGQMLFNDNMINFIIQYSSLVYNFQFNFFYGDNLNKLTYLLSKWLNIFIIY